MNRYLCAIAVGFGLIITIAGCGSSGSSSSTPAACTQAQINAGTCVAGAANGGYCMPCTLPGGSIGVSTNGTNCVLPSAATTTCNSGYNNGYYNGGYYNGGYNGGYYGGYYPQPQPWYYSPYGGYTYYRMYRSVR